MSNQMNKIGTAIGGTAGSTINSDGSQVMSSLMGGNSPLSNNLGLMTSGGGNSMTQNLIGSVVGSVTDKLGLPPWAAQVATAFVVSKLAGEQAQQVQDTGITSVLGLIAKGGDASSALQSTGMAKELGGLMGLDESTASQGIQSVLGGLLQSVAK